MKKVKGPIIAAVVVILMVVVGMIVFSLKGRTVKISDNSIKMSEEKGIHYGGTFDEFQYFEEESEEETESESVLSREEILSEVEKIREEFMENAPGDIIKEEGGEANVNDKKVNNQEEPVVELVEDENGEVSSFGKEFKLDGYSENEVLYKTTELKDAEAVAAQIGGTVISCENGTATIKINEHVDALLERLENEGSGLILYRKYYIAR